jgi:hypothetical protein
MISVTARRYPDAIQDGEHGEISLATPDRGLLSAVWETMHAPAMTASYRDLHLLIRCRRPPREYRVRIITGIGSHFVIRLYGRA